MLMISGSSGTVFIEVAKQEKPWLFMIDEYDE